MTKVIGEVDKEQLLEYDPPQVTALKDLNYCPSRKYRMLFKKKALKSYWDFIHLIDFKGGNDAFGAIHYELANWLQDAGKRRVVLMPRGHLKSTLCSVGYVLWRIYQNPNIRILVGTATKPLAESFVREVKQYLEDEELKDRVWNARPHVKGPMIPELDRSSKPRSRRVRGDDENFDEGYTEATDKKVVWAAKQLQVVRPKIMREPTLMASSVGSPNTGFHFDLAIFDDLVTFDNSNTEAKAEKIVSWVADMESVIDPYNSETRLGEEVIILGTRYFHRDLYGLFTQEDLSPEEKEDLADDRSDLHLKAADDWHVFKRNIYANGHDDSDGYLWPERFDRKEIQRIRARMARLPSASRRFASQYLNAIISDEEVVLDPKLVQYLHHTSIKPKSKDGCVKIQSNSTVEPIYVKPYIVVDPAVSLKKRADNTVVMCGGVDEAQNLYVFRCTAGKLRTLEIINAIYDMVETYGVYSVRIDNEKLGQALVQSIRREWQTNKARVPLCLLPFKPEGEKKGRIAAHLQPRFTNNQIFMHSAMARHSIIQEEIMFFPRQNAHDDCLDAMAMLCEVALPSRKHRPHAANRSRQMKFNSRYGGVR